MFFYKTIGKLLKLTWIYGCFKVDLADFVSIGFCVLILFLFLVAQKYITKKPLSSFFEKNFSVAFSCLFNFASRGVLSPNYNVVTKPIKALCRLKSFKELVWTLKNVPLWLCLISLFFQVAFGQILICRL